MKILSVNAGSSSLKFRLYEMPEENLLISGVFERIGIEGSFYTIKYNGEKIKKEVELKNHKDAFNYLVSELLENKVVTSLEEIKGIVEYLNIKSNSHYKYSTDKTQTLIKARIKDGFTLDDFKIVIDKKCEEWLGTDFEKFLRPETLFSNKFEGYLNQKITAKKKTLKDISMSDIDRAIEIERKGSGLF